MTAARECDKVFVHISDADRDNVTGEAMGKVWNHVADRILPDKVWINILHKESPVRRVWTYLGDADKGTSNDEFVLYGDPLDLQDAFPEKSLKKYLPRLTGSNLVVTRPIAREETDGISGTQMREWLRSSDKERFVANLPDGLDGDHVWDLLKA